MSSFDPVAVNALRDAQHYSYLLNEAASFEREKAEQDRYLRRACEAIQKLDLEPESVRQLVASIGCRMKVCGFSDSDVEAIETAGDVL